MHHAADALALLGRTVHAAATVLTWVVAATIAIGVALALLEPQAVGPRLADALWAGALVAVVLTLGGRIVLGCGLQLAAQAVRRRAERRRPPGA